MEQQDPIGCGVAFTALFGCIAVFVIMVLALLGPAVGNVLSGVVEAL